VFQASIAFARSRDRARVPHWRRVGPTQLGVRREKCAGPITGRACTECFGRDGDGCATGTAPFGGPPPPASVRTPSHERRNHASGVGDPVEVARAEIFDERIVWLRMSAGARGTSANA